MFVSYAKEDKDIMNKVRAILEKNEIQTWVDIRKNFNAQMKKLCLTLEMQKK